MTNKNKAGLAAERLAEVLFSRLNCQKQVGRYMEGHANITKLLIGGVGTTKTYKLPEPEGVGGEWRG